MPQGIGGWGDGESVGTLQGVTRASGEMADALASGASDRKIVGVQVPPRPPLVLGKTARRRQRSRALP